MKKKYLRGFTIFPVLFVWLAIGNLTSSASAAASGDIEELSRLSVKIQALNRQLQRSRAGHDSAKFEINELAKSRFDRLNVLAEENPAAFFRVAFSSEVAAKFPENSQNYFERQADVEGELEILYECDDFSERLKYFVKTKTERLPIYFAEQPDAELTTGSRVRVKGLRIGDKLVSENGGEMASLQVLESVAANTFGEQKTLLLLVNFLDDQRQPYTVEQANNLLFNQVNSQSVTNFYREASYQQTWLTGDSYGWFTLPINSGDCNGTQTAAAARQAATNAGINLSAYNKFIYVYPNMPACNYSGIGGVGGNEIWINGSLYLRTVAHELGHNFGIYHSRSMDCGAAAVGSVCTTTEYGNTADMMGYPGVTGQFHAFQKERLGWLNYGNSPPITTVQTSGDYFITANSAQDFQPKALKIQKSAGEFYYIELRRLIGFDSTLSTALTNGVVITMNQTASSKENYLLDMTPETTYWTDAALPVGRSWTDATAGFTITPVSVGNGGATVNVSFGTQPPQTSCVSANPTITASPTATQWISAGSAVSYNVTVTNNNSSACSANTFNVANTVSSGWSQTTAAPILNIAPGASQTTTVQIVSPRSAAGGFYTIGLSAANSANTSYAASVSASLSVYSSLSVAVSSDQPNYNSTQTVNLTTNVAANGAAMSGANATFTIKRPDGTIAATGTAATGANGAAVYSYRFNRKKDTLGTYQVSVNAALNGVSGNGATSFVLIK